MIEDGLIINDIKIFHTSSFGFSDLGNLNLQLKMFLKVEG